MATGFNSLKPPSSQYLDKRVEIRQRTDIPVGINAVSSLYSDPVKRWARIQPVGTAAYTNGLQSDHKLTHRIWLRRMGGISTVHEVTHGGHVYRVLRCADLDGGNDFTLLDVEQLQ